MALRGEYPSPFLERRAAGNNEVKRGDAILISMENYASDNRKRHGAAVDRGKLEVLFNWLSFEVHEHLDKTAEDLKTILKNISTRKPEETSDCFVCYVSAHGDTDSHGHYIEAIKGPESDSKVYIYDDILKPFLTSDALKGIPKVFFIDCCRGNSSRIISQSTESVVDYMKTAKDTLVVFSTDEGNESLRNTESGTFFVQALCKVIPLKLEIEDVRAMVRMANNILIRNSMAHFQALKSNKCGKKKCQVPQIHFNLTGKLFWRTHLPSKASADQIKKAENFIVGQDDLREKLKKWLTDTKGTSAAGGVESQSFIVSGMGGIGKTTLAKSLFEDNEIKYYYDHRVYWVSVKKDPDIVKRQRLLISEICKATPSVEVDNSTLLLEELKDKLSRTRRIFLILDDVWETKDVENLLGNRFLDTLPPGSKCIITTRKPAELEKLDASIQVEKLDVLNGVDAKKLFYNKAFLNGILPDNMKPSRVDEVIDACGRVPILLAAIGADRWGIESTESWEEVRDRLKHIATEKHKSDDDELAESDKLIKQLRISYDDLPEWNFNSGHVINYKDCFLDFAAFGKREEIEISVLMDLWTKPGLTEDETYEILEELEQRCLVRMDGYTCRVHDIFRTLAVTIIEEQPLKKRTRLFAWGLINSRLPDEWGISQNVGTGHDDRAPDVVMFETEKMVIAKSELKEFHPKDAILFTCLSRLRMLFLTSNLNLVKLPPAIKHMKSLEKLDLSWCLGLKQLPKEIGQLESLEKLNTAGCCSLTEIPAEVGNLKKLLELNMQSCGILKLPDEIGGLKSLTYLCLNDCNRLEILPAAMGKLSSLERLECEMLPIKEIPKALGDLSKLKHLSFAACGSITGIPAEFVKLENAISFCFASCFQLETVPVELDQLTKGSLAVFDISDTRVMSQNLPPSLRELQSNSQDSNGKRETEGEAEPKNRYMRGVLVDPTSVFHPNIKEERRVSFGLARIISMVKTEPFLSQRFDLAIRLMRTMANHDGTRHAIVRSGGLSVLLRCIDKGDPDRCGFLAAATLRNICRTHSTHKAVVDAGALSILTRVLIRKNDIKFYAYQALIEIRNGDIEERDFAFTSEINERCGHDFRNCNGECNFCKVELDFDGNIDVKRRLRR